MQQNLGNSETRFFSVYFFFQYKRVPKYVRNRSFRVPSGLSLIIYLSIAGLKQTRGLWTCTREHVPPVVYSLFVPLFAWRKNYFYIAKACTEHCLRARVARFALVRLPARSLAVYRTRRRT